MSSIEISLNQVNRASFATPSTPETVVHGDAKRVGITTLGCKVNSYESELIAQTLNTQDWVSVPAYEEADLYLINTCTVTKEADRQARQAVRRAVKRNPDALVVVTGCYAQMDAQACAEIPGVDLVLGNDQKLDVHNLLPKLEAGELPKVMVGDLDQHVSLPDHIVTGFEAHTRAFVQIQQGCDQGCTFCIIHVARGPSRSLPLSLIKRQVQRLVLNGYPEIVICGVDLGAYGDDLQHSEINLVSLLKELLALECDPDNPFRIRLSSIDPYHISDQLIELLASEPRLCNQFHLSMQSGNSLILKRMKRRYDAAFLRGRIQALRAQIPDFVMSADVMVGFPTETESQYQDTEDMLRELDIAYPHVFSYSERQGTPAARIPSAKQVPVPERKARNQRLREAGKVLEKALLERKIDTEFWVLPEQSKRDDGYVLCRAEDYVPILLPEAAIKRGQWLKVRAKRLENGQLYAD